MRVKLCGIRSVDDARLCEAEGADELGVIFALGSKRRVSPSLAREIREAVKVPVVGVFKDVSFEEALRVVQEAGLAAAQLHGPWPLHGQPVIPAYAALQVMDESALTPRPGAARVLLDGPAGGSGKSFAWGLTARARELYDVPLFIAGGLTPENVQQAIAEAKPDGVDVASGIEGPDGFKDRARVRAFVRAARGESL